MKMKMLKKDDITDLLSNSKKNLYIWGCSDTTRTFLEENSEVEVEKIIDNNNSLGSYLGYKVINPSALINLSNVIVLVHGNHCKSIFEQIKTLPLPDDVEVIFNYENGGRRIIDENFYAPFDDLLKIDLDLINQNTEVMRLSHIKKKGLDKNILVPLEMLENKKSKELAIEYLNKYINCNKVYVGCGEDFKEGYLHCDIRSLEHVDIVCKAWELPLKISNVSKIYSRHMLEHLTQREAHLTLTNWFNSLSIDGELELIVPNFDLRAKQWLDCSWDEDTYPSLDEKWAIAGCWGWQRECDPTKEDYNQSYWDVHKSGYNEKRLKVILKKIGFSDIQTKVDEKNNLISIAYKRT